MVSQVKVKKSIKIDPSKLSIFDIKTEIAIAKYAQFDTAIFPKPKPDSKKIP